MGCDNSVVWYIDRFIFSFGRNFLMFLSSALSTYTSERAHVYVVSVSIFYCLSAARYSLRRVSSVPCRMSSAAAVGGARQGVRCGGGRPSPATQTRGVCSESMVEFVCVMENVDVVAQQSTASVPTCSDSKTRSQRSFLTFSVSGHVPLMLLLRTLPSVLASVRRSTYFRTFFLLYVRNVC